jgi:hypothetical protein
MLPRWRRVRLIITGTFTIIAAGMLVLAYAIIGRFPGVTVATLGLIALLLPVGFYLLATVVGWQRSIASGAMPNALVGWIIRNNMAPVLPIMFMFLLLGLGNEMNLAPIDRSANSDAAVSRSIRDACVAGARQEILKTGGDPNAVALGARVTAYCDCMTAAVQREYTPDEFVRLASDSGDLDKDTRMTRIIDRCAKAAPG